MSFLGNRVERIEDERMLTVGGDYVGDLRLPGAAHAIFVTSMIAHGVIESIDADDARAMPGVLGVFTHDGLGLDPLPPGFAGEEFVRTPMATDRVRYVGEPVAVVVAETMAQAIDAAEMVIVDVDPLPPVVDLLTAAEDPTVVHEPKGSNIAIEFPDRRPLDFGDCEVVVEGEILNQRVAPCPIEPRVAAVTWEDGRLVQWASSQGAHGMRDALAAFHGLEPTDVRVIVPDVGGGFGAKGQPHPEELLLGAVSRAVGRPVTWTETRSQNMTGMVHGRAQHQHVKIGGTADGRITHWSNHVVQDGGAHPGIGAMLPFAGRMMLCGVYDIEHTSYGSRSVVTTTTPVGAYRGAGRPEAAAAIERAVDLFAAEAGLDPAEVRRRNYLAPDVFPYDTGNGTTYDSGDYERSLDLALEAADYEALRAEQARRRAEGDHVQVGIGIATYVEITAMGGGGEYVTAELRPGGGVLLRTGASPYGQGHDTTWAMIVADRLGIGLDDIEIHHGDTDEIPTGNITGGSRSAQLVGSSVQDASTRLLELARQRAADLLEAAVEDVVHDVADGGRFHVAGSPAQAIGWADVAGSGEALVGASEFEQADPTFPFGTHVAVVEVDIETGGVRLRRHVAVDDAGTLLNPLTADGQVHGGLAQGAAQALLESVEYDTDGNPLTTNFADYSVISAAELPLFDRVEMETPTPLNPLGAKGIGESATVGSTPAIQNAVCDALAPFGIRHVDMPCTPMRIWEALRAAGG